jgi:hypothetical protein
MDKINRIVKPRWTLIKGFSLTCRSKHLIKDALYDNDFLANLDSTQTREIIDYMYPIDVVADSFIIRQGKRCYITLIFRDLSDSKSKFKHIFQIKSLFQCKNVKYIFIILNIK